MKYRKFAAIDIGSNAVRLLISNILEHKNGAVEIKKNSMVRVPIRLGEDVFTKGMISIRKAGHLIDAMQAFKILMRIHKVENYKAVATSAVRSAENGKELVERVLEKIDINIEVIDGTKEAEIIFLTNIKKYIKEDKSYLYIDVGGGSTEFTIFSKGKVMKRKSFPVGTVRFINGKVKEEYFKGEVKDWVKENTKTLENVTAIGSGGNINKIYKMAEVKEGTPLTYDYLKKQYDFLKGLTYDQRMDDLGLNPDRADVIVPAIRIYLSAMKWSRSQKIYVPKIGLADGTIRYICKEKGII
ncbi:MAG: Ppx/GppA phosphatase family protein [Flavobacteriales bacterium]